MPDSPNPEIGFDVPARVGMALEEVQTPCLIVDLDAFEANLVRMRKLADASNVGLRAHAKCINLWT